MPKVPSTLALKKRSRIQSRIGLFVEFDFDVRVHES